MTDIVPTSAGTPARSSYSEAKAARVREALTRVRANYLAVFRDIDDARLSHNQRALQVADRGGWIGDFLHPQLSAPEQPRTEDDRVAGLRRLDMALVDQPDRSGILGLRDRALAAATEGYAMPPARLAVGLMINSFPNARPHSPESYQEALVDQLEATGLGPAPIAKACNDLVRKSTFVPTAAEVVAAANDAQSALRIFVIEVERFRAIADWVPAARSWLEDVELLQPDRMNWTACSPVPEHSIRWSLIELAKSEGRR